MTNEKLLNLVGAIPASSFVVTLNANVDNDKVSDAEFREFVRNTLPIVHEVIEHNIREHQKT